MSVLPPEFVQAEQQRCELTRQYQQQTISPDQYAAAISTLRVVDRQGITWQPDPATPGWLVWDGTSWQRSDPSWLPQPRRIGGDESPGKLRRSKGSLALAHRDSNRGRVPLNQRPRHWWDALTVWMGILAGLSWLAYSLFRSFSLEQLLASIAALRFDSLPVLLILVIPLLLLLTRRTILARLNLFLLRFDPWSTGVKLFLALFILAGLAAAGWAAIWALQASPALAVWANLDVATPLALASIPLLLVLFRRESDFILRPLAYLLRPIPRVLLILAALALPFLFSYLFANWIPFTPNGLLRWNTIFSSLVSYILLRTPAGVNRPFANRMPAAAGIWLATVGMLVVELLFGDHAAWAYTSDDSAGLAGEICTCGVARGQAAAAAQLGVLGTAGSEIVRQQSGAGQAAEPADRTRLLSGSRALDWLRANGFIDTSNRFTPAFQAWYDRPSSDESPTELHGIAGVFDPVAGTVPATLTVVVSAHRNPPAPDAGASTGPADTGAGPTVVVPKAPPQAKSDSTPQPAAEAPPTQRAPTPPEPATLPPVETLPQAEPILPLDQPPAPPRPQSPPADAPDLHDLNVLANLNSIQADLIRCAGFGGGCSLNDITKSLYKLGDRIRAPFEAAYDWYQTTWMDFCKGSDVTEEDRLPERIAEHGLYDTSRESLFMQGYRQSLINAGVEAPVADEVLKRVEAEGVEDAQIARLATKLLRSVRALNQGAQANVEGGLGAGTAAAGHDLIGPDPTSIVERMTLTQQSNYQGAVDRWRDTQNISRWTQTGAGVTSPQTQQDVDRLLNDLRQEQRLLKKQLGFDMNKMRNSEDMRRMWREEQALKDLRQECADLNLLRRLHRR